MSDRREATDLLRAWQRGDQAALDRLSSLCYEELRAVARRLMRSEASGHTLQATALVNEAFARLIDVQVDFESRRHFLALTARTMRRVLVDHARAQQRAKRGERPLRVTLDESRFDAVEPFAVLELDDALEQLAGFDPRLGQAVELTYFGGLTPDEAAAQLGVSRSQLYEDLKFARAWLHAAMS